MKLGVHVRKLWLKRQKCWTYRHRKTHYLLYMVLDGLQESNATLTPLQTSNHFLCASFSSCTTNTTRYLSAHNLLCESLKRPLIKISMSECTKENKRMFNLHQYSTLCRKTKPKIKRSKQKRRVRNRRNNSSRKNGRGGGLESANIEGQHHQ